MNENAHILICGRDSNLLETRGLVLRKAGYRVSTTTQPIQQAPALNGLDLLIVCHTLSTEERRNDLSVLACAAPQAPALCLTPHKGPVEPHIPTLDSYQGPHEMLRVVNQLLSA